MTRDRRNHGRRRVTEEFTLFDRLTNTRIGRIVNLSLEGALVASEQPVETPCVFACRLDLPKCLHGFEKIEFDIQGKWCKPNEATGMHETGYKFLSLTPECKRLIRVILERWSTPDTKAEPSAEKVQSKP